MYSSDLTKTIVQKYPGTTEIPPVEKFIRNPEPQVDVPPAQLKKVCEGLKSDPDLQFDLPIQMTAVDYLKDGFIELVYYLYSTKKKHAVVLKSKINRTGQAIDSVTGIWAGMDFQEREVFDLFGVTFNGHPNLKRIMMWDGFPGYPLRKDYVHVTDKYDSGLEVGTPGFDEKGLPIKKDTP